MSDTVADFAAGVGAVCTALSVAELAGAEEAEPVSLACAEGAGYAATVASGVGTVASTAAAVGGDDSAWRKAQRDSVDTLVGVTGSGLSIDVVRGGPAIATGLDVLKDLALSTVGNILKSL
jgi:hypothetical protein